MQDGTDITQRVKEVVVQALKLNIDPDEIADDESLFGEGLGADSTATLEIIFALEEEFDFEADDEELRVELFDSVRTLSQYVTEKIGQGQLTEVFSENI
jgi:acyl carrier protein